jgi:hypothetical protein
MTLATSGSYPFPTDRRKFHYHISFEPATLLLDPVSLPPCEEQLRQPPYLVCRVVLPQLIDPIRPVFSLLAASYLFH